MYVAASLKQSAWRGQGARGAFTLVELLVVIGIIALLAATLLPALNAINRSARTLRCATNVRQLCMALLCYASENRGAFPPNCSTPLPGQYWHDAERIGRYLPGVNRTGGGGPIAEVMVCPEDAGGRRSYAMNFWVSSKVDGDVPMRKGGWGALWRRNTSQAAQVILITESWSALGWEEGGWLARPYVGAAGHTPGQRFGARGGIVPPMQGGRYGELRCELPYARHRGVSAAALLDPVGRINIGYVDGHVETKSHDELTDKRGLSTLNSLWSPMDAEYNY